MFDISSIKNENQKSFYEALYNFVEGILHEEKDPIANLANVASLLYNTLDNVNWAGFYLLKEEELVLGPFQGKPACIRIKLGEGVCGKAVSEKSTQRVMNVHEFPGHIACDGDTNSEIVIPLYHEQRIIAVLDIDSLILNRFNATDQEELEKIARYVSDGCNWEVIK
ncbi:GAF domain-containing protein [Vallitaleaceae bacterium 9-2]